MGGRARVHATALSIVSVWVVGCYHAEPIDAGALLREFVDAANAGAPAGVRVELTAPSSMIVIASRERFGQVIDNVLSNAVSFSPVPGAVSVTLVANGPRARITVEDAGPGMPAAHLERIFDRFFSYRPDDPGREHVGLGLAIARQIVESYGGTITASNRERGAARFEIDVPARQV